MENEMTNAKTGGPAFPTPSGWNHEGKWVQDSCDFNGITIRDYFAAKAMSYWLCIPMDKDNLNKVAVESYKVADAMLEARK
jgi:hypothetical protein